MLVELYPNAVKEQDKVGRLPLHSACSNQASLAVIEYLVEQYPESISEMTDRGVSQNCRQLASIAKIVAHRALR